MLGTRTHASRWVAARLFVLSIAGAMALSACAGSDAAGTAATSNASGTSVLAQFASMSPAERDSQLATIAKSEGGLELYTSFHNFAPVVADFKARYGVTVTIFQGESSGLSTRLTQEQTANRQTADLVETNETDVVSVSKYLYSGVTFDTSKLLPGSVGPNYVADRENVYGTVWNTKKVSDAQVPAEFKDLADPQWKGKIVAEVTDSPWYAGMKQYYMSQGMSDAQATQTVQAVLANAKGASGHTQTQNLVSAGQYDFSPDELIQTVAEAKDKDASNPIAFRKADGSIVAPLILLPAVIGVVANAPHPAAALLFVDYLLSDQGQDEIVSSHAAGSTTEGLKEISGLPMYSIDVAKYLADPSYDAQYKQALQ